MSECQHFIKIFSTQTEFLEPVIIFIDFCNYYSFAVCEFCDRSGARGRSGGRCEEKRGVKQYVGSLECNVGLDWLSSVHMSNDVRVSFIV